MLWLQNHHIYAPPHPPLLVSQGPLCPLCSGLSSAPSLACPGESHCPRHLLLPEFSHPLNPSRLTPVIPLWLATSGDSQPAAPSPVRLTCMSHLHPPWAACKCVPLASFQCGGGALPWA